MAAQPESCTLRRVQTARRPEGEPALQLWDLRAPLSAIVTLTEATRIDSILYAVLNSIHIGLWSEM